MTDGNPNDTEVQVNSVLLCCQHLCASKFEDEALRSKSAAKYKDHSEETTDKINIRGRWSNRIEFLLSCIGFAVGLGNFWRFPIRVYYGGGGAFLIPYTLLCLTLGSPMLIMEMGLGQFSSLSPVKAFKLVPVLYGIGWCMFMININILIYHGVIMAWSYHYLFGSLHPIMAWTVCNNYFNSIDCIGSNSNLRGLDRNQTYVTSTLEYWDYYVTGFMKYPSREIYTMNENPGKPQWHLILCLLFVWGLAGLALMFSVKVSGKIIYFTVLFPYFVIFLLIILALRLPGAWNGIKYYLRPAWGKMLDPLILRGAIEQLLFSCSISIGGMITYSSYNNFRDNIYRDAIIVIFVDFLTSFLAGFAVFSILGYMAHRSGLPIEKIITSGASLFFVTYPEALATISGSNFWTIMLMLMAISLGTDIQFAMVETIIAGLLDISPKIRHSKKSKAICVWMICTGFFLAGILLCTPGGMYYFDILDIVASYGLSIIAFLETVAIGLIYGFKQFRYDCRMMVGFSPPLLLFIAMAFEAPITIGVVLIASIIQYERIQVAGKFIPIWGELLALLFLLIMLSPVFICAVHTIVTYKRKYPELVGKLLVKKLFNAPIYWGPRQCKHWLLGDFYRDKMHKYKADPRFLKYFSDCENKAKDPEDNNDNVK